ncbi:hypothetical protein [Vogesella sp. LIG4]|uniref:hypothetical protein n=1 Tax=Vogesella sp. LIG4 TaxID=1192162 RepID=UPI0008200CFC|nr:hypothetical protein [Vogesella sp. LIG4]SCK30413.1 hypothetical protein PSELUDRAFT_3782 [Vogesella sp. LIG4]
MPNVLQQYLDVFQAAQQRWLEAHSDYLQQLWRQPLLPTHRQQLAQQLENSLASGASLLRASADLHNDLQVLNERWLGRQQKCWQEYLTTLPKPFGHCMLPMDASLSGCLIASRASRQINHFASTRLSNAPLQAVRGAQRSYRQPDK